MVENLLLVVLILCYWYLETISSVCHVHHLHIHTQEWLVVNDISDLQTIECNRGSSSTH